MIFLLGVTFLLDGIAYFVKSICVRDTDIVGAGTESTCSRSAYIEITWTGGRCAKDAYTGVATRKSSYIRGICIVECLRMHLQFFQILEVRGARLKIRVKIG